MTNLTFLSKVLERAVKARLSTHLQRNDLFDKYQSAYRSSHSTETALLRIVNDLQNAADIGQVGLLVLLDLSAAFDTIDHSLLTHQLEYQFGVTDGALTWFKSYLSDRSHRVQNIR